MKWMLRGENWNVRTLYGVLYEYEYVRGAGSSRNSRVWSISWWPDSLRSRDDSWGTGGLARKGRRRPATRAAARRTRALWAPPAPRGGPTAARDPRRPRSSWKRTHEHMPMNAWTKEVMNKSIDPRIQRSIKFHSRAYLYLDPLFN